MKNSTVTNDVQVIQNVLEEFLGNRKAEKVAVEISSITQNEAQYTYDEDVFFVHKDETGKLILTTETSVKENVQAILNSYLEKDEVQECIEMLMTVNCKTKATESETINIPDSNSTKKATKYDTIKIPGSDSPIYTELLKHEPAKVYYNDEDEDEDYYDEDYYDAEVDFIDNLKNAISNSVKEFEVFVNDPSIHDDNFQFVPGFPPAVDYSYNELEERAKRKKFRLGTKDEYILFCGWLINSLINEGWSEEDAWDAVCHDSYELGHYSDSAYAKDDLEPTGSRMVAGKCDLANTYKILAIDEDDTYWFAGGCFNTIGKSFPLAKLNFEYNYYDIPIDFCVGWFVR